MFERRSLPLPQNGKSLVPDRAMEAWYDPSLDE